MILQKRLKAGVLVYALLMAAIFLLLLQFYLDRVVANQRQNKALANNSQAYLIAQMVKDQAKQPSGSLSFEQGQASYQKEGQLLTVKVSLSDGASYSYDFVENESSSSSSSDKDKSKDKSKSSSSSDPSRDKSQPSSSTQSASSQSDDEKSSAG
ncbi:competence type IV pilus minor pilin ComGG [Streptococcus downei]|uniref:Competence protein ComGG n=1 Tax=Streptococcus downei MFe28 TaxID=764290 RepID=A0A380JBT0_STRDO|nr:competence type IV pilus minor pilin ComGG [Streptococcus downei]SUN35528.1 competence protein ComGG [Streptococcus downei MFe28]